MGKMRVFKFGGASVKDADAVRNVARIIGMFPNENIAVVVSAMGKTTNALEALTNHYYTGEGELKQKFEELEEFHYQIISDLFEDNNHTIYEWTNKQLAGLEITLNSQPSDNYDFEYDQIVSKGELLSTTIVNAYLNEAGINSNWYNAKKLVKTDNNYREAKVDWAATELAIHQNLVPYFNQNDNQRIAITQGFIGSDGEYTTTLGREGSDYTGAILAYCLNADNLTIWKDVPGMLNADPKWFDNTEQLSQISYREAIELAYYGASVIHPKTIQPLQNKKISLHVRSFIHPENAGTIIHQSEEGDDLIPSFIFKMDQVLISMSPHDFSFIVEENLSHIFKMFAEAKVKINIMQTSAISFSVSVTNDERRLPQLLDELNKHYNVKYNTGLELVTIRHYDQPTIDRVTANKKVLVSQQTRTTARMVMRDIDLAQAND